MPVGVCCRRNAAASTLTYPQVSRNFGSTKITQYQDHALPRSRSFGLIENADRRAAKRSSRDGNWAPIRRSHKRLEGKQPRISAAGSAHT